MKSVEDILRSRFVTAIGLAFGAEYVTDPLIKPADPRFGDYQANCAMALAKTLKQKPRDVAAAIVRHVQLSDMADEPTLAGPGFINIKLKPEWIARHLTEGYAAGRAGLEPAAEPQTIVVDYSAPNVAKQMHIGHLRPTVIGDTFVRVLESLGHTVVRQNHIGDYGTQFGMLIAYLRKTGKTGKAGTPLTIKDLDRTYREAAKTFREDPAFAKVARQTVVEFQSGGTEAVALWKQMLEATREHYTRVYELLNITLDDEHTRGESFYGPRLPRIVERVKQTLEFGGENAAVVVHAGTDTSLAAREADDLLETIDVPDPEKPEAPETRVEDAAEGPEISKAFAAMSDGALCIFLPGYVSKGKTPLPIIVQKRDGGFGYAATDLAAIYFRIQENKRTPEEQAPLTADWHADRIIYTTDARQKLHFAMVFDAVRAAQWDVNPKTLRHVPLEHAPFGSIMGEDNRPFKTRSGDVVALGELLQEAIDRATAIVKEKNPDLPADRQQSVGRAVGMGAVKYSDLRQDRIQDYVFSWQRMLSFEGNTGPYLQYGHTRIAGIFRKAGLSREAVRTSPHPLALQEPQELAVARTLLQFSPTVEAVARDLKPHYLCTYLYDLTSTFFSFYEACPVLKAPDEATKFSRLRLCDLVAQTLTVGLHDLLGIEALEEM